MGVDVEAKRGRGALHDGNVYSIFYSSKRLQKRKVKK